VCYRVLQCATVCYSVLQVLQCATVCYSLLQCATGCYSVLQCATGCYSVLQFATVCYSLLQCATVCYRALQCAGNVTLPHVKRQWQLTARSAARAYRLAVLRSAHTVRLFVCLFCVSFTTNSNYFPNARTLCCV